MPIIYTYPKLLNPIGNELVVITDVNDKKFTKQITIAQIAGLLPGGDGCGTAITEIVDNLGASLYTAPACSPMEIVSSDGTVSITSTGSGINLSASAASGCEAALTTILTPNGPVTVTECDSAIEFSVLPESSLSIAGAGNTIEFSLGCPTESERGGIKASSVGLPQPPEPSETGEYYPVQITGGSDCVGVVRVPSGGDPYVLPCAEPATLGGIKALNNTTVAEAPAAAESGEYYPIETLTNTDTQADECRAVVRIPSSAGEDATLVASQTSGTDVDPNLTLTSGLNTDNVQIVGGTGIDVNRITDSQITISSQAATPGNGQITIAAGTGLTGGGSFTVNQAGNSTITLNASGSGGSETGWSPMTITNSATTLPVQESDPLTLFFHATADATLNINSIKMMLTDVDGAGNPNKDDDFSVALYSGSLTDVANGGPTPTLIGSWTYAPGGAAVYGVKKVFNAIATSVTAGNDYVIAVSVRANGAQLLGDGVIYGGFGSLFMSNQYLCVGNNNAYGTPLADEWPSNMPDTTFTSTYRYAIHFYEGGEEAGEGEGGGSGDGETESEKG